jgi:hypothetical protein
VAAVLRVRGAEARYLSPKEGGLLLSEEFGNAQLLPESYRNLSRINQLPGVTVFPGFFGQEIEAQLDRQFTILIEKLGLRDGCMNFDAFVSKGTVYIIDVGLRNGGNYVPDVIQLSTGFDLTAAAIYAAMGMEYPIPWVACPAPLQVASYLVGSRFHGRYGGMDIDPALQPFVVKYRPFLQPGEEIQPYTRADLAAGIQFLSFPTQAVMRANVAQIEDLVTVHVKPIRPGDSALENRPAVFKDFREQLSPFLRTKLAEAEAEGDETTVRVLTREFVDDIHKEGGTVLGTSRGPVDTGIAVDHLIRRGVNLLFIGVSWKSF